MECCFEDGVLLRRWSVASKMKCSFEAGVFFCGEQAVLCGGRGEIASKNQPRMVLKPINGVRPAGNFPDQEGTITCPNDCPPADVMRDGVNRRRVCHNGAVLHRAVAFYGLHWVEELRDVGEDSSPSGSWPKRSAATQGRQHIFGAPDISGEVYTLLVIWIEEDAQRRGCGPDVYIRRRSVASRVGEGHYTANSSPWNSGLQLVILNIHVFGAFVS